MYGFRSGGMGGLGDTCSDLATTWYNNLATCNAQGISNTNPACIAANQAYAQGPVDNCNPAVFAATQALAANPTATQAQLQQIVSQQIAGQTSDQIAAAVALVMSANPSGATSTPVIIPGSTIVSTSPSGQTVYQMATAANNPVTGAPAVVLPTTNQLAPIIPASSPLASTVSVIDTQAGQVSPVTGTVIPPSGQPTLNTQTGNVTPAAAGTTGDSFSLCFPGDPSGQISSSLPICTYTLVGIIGLFLLLKR